MKRIGLIFFISCFWLLTSGFYIYAQDTETLTLVTYYPAPYAAYQGLDLMRNSANTTLTISAYHNTELTTPTLTFRKADNTMASPLPVDTNAVLGTINFQGYDNDSFETGASIYAIADNNWGVTERGTDLHFQTRDGNFILLDRMTISAEGNIGIRIMDPEALVHIRASNYPSSPAWRSEDTFILEKNNDLLLQIHTPPDKVGGLMFSDNERAKGYIRYNHDDNSMQLWTNGGNRFTIRSNGNIDIISGNLWVQDGTVHASCDSWTAGLFEGEGNTVGVYASSDTSPGVFGSSTSGAGIHGSSSSSYGVRGQSSSSYGVYGSSSSSYGVRGQSSSSYGVYGYSSSSYGVYGYSRNSGSYDFYAGGLGTNYGPFTGAHDVKLNSSIKDIEPGMIVVATGEGEIRNDTISSVLITVEPAYELMDRRVFGVFVAEQKLPEEHWYKPKERERFGIVNALGEGLVWVTDINGHLENGDYITTSPVAGYGQKQDEDILHSYTLGKVIQVIDWDKITDFIEYNGKKYKRCLIAVTYHCG